MRVEGSMTRLTPVAFRPARSFRASAIATLVAPTHPLGRVGSALAFTVVLAAVQLGLVAGHTGPDLCRLRGSACTAPAPVAGGRLLENPSSGVQKAPRGPRSSTPTSSNPSQAEGSIMVQTVAFHTRALAQRPGGRHKVAKSAHRGASAAPQKHRAAKTRRAKDALSASLRVGLSLRNVATAQTRSLSHPRRRAGRVAHRRHLR